MSFWNAMPLYRSFSQLGSHVLCAAISEFLFLLTRVTQGWGGQDAALFPTLRELQFLCELLSSEPKTNWLNSLDDQLQVLKRQPD